MKYFIFLLVLLPIFSIGQVYNIRANASSGSNPTLSVTPGTLTLTSVINAQGGSQIYSLTGSNLGTNVVAVGPLAGYVVSKDNITFTTSVTVTPSAGNVAQTIYVALSSSNSSAGTVNGNLPNIVTGVSEVDVVCSGTVSGTSMSVAPTSITGLNSVAGVAGSSQTVAITFANLVGNITVTSFTPVELSTDGSTFFGSGSPITFSTGSPKTVFLREASSGVAGAVSGNVTIATSGVSTINLPVTGTISSGARDTGRFVFSLTSYSPPSGFTDVFGDPATGIRTGTSGVMSFSTIATANWPPFTGPTCAFDAFGFLTGSTVIGFPDPILGHAFFTISFTGGHQADSTTLGFGTPQYQITGLSNTKTYTVKATASINKSSASFASTNRYWLSNGTTNYLATPSDNAAAFLFTADNNTTRFMTWTGVVPDGTGKIKGYLWTISGQEACEIEAIEVFQTTP